MSYFSEAHVWNNRKKLRRLRQEFDLISLFDRLQNYATESTPGGGQGNCSARANRRSEILAQIAALEARASWSQERYARLAALAVLISTRAHGIFHQLLR